MEREHICGGCGSREDVGYLVDAEATIAALQARVQELEHRLEIDVALDVDGNEIPAPLNMPDGIYCRDATIQLQNEALSELESQLTQRTAELEAVKAELNTVRRDAGLDCGDHSCLYAMNKTGMRTNGGCRCSPKRMKNDLERSRKAYDDLQAELERVRGELQKLECGSTNVKHRQGMEG